MMHVTTLLFILTMSFASIDNTVIDSSSVEGHTTTTEAVSENIDDKNSAESDAAMLAEDVSEDFDQEADWEKATSIYQFRVKDIDGQDVSLEKYRGHVLIVVNVASKSELENNVLADMNYPQLQELYEKYGASEGLKILAFPCDQFGEHGTSGIQELVEKYKLKFDLFEKVDVNGENAAPLWKWLRKQNVDSDIERVRWSCEKFVVDKRGKVISRHPFFVRAALLEVELVCQLTNRCKPKEPEPQTCSLSCADKKQLRTMAKSLIDDVTKMIEQKHPIGNDPNINHDND